MVLAIFLIFLEHSVLEGFVFLYISQKNAAWNSCLKVNNNEESAIGFSKELLSSYIHKILSHDINLDKMDEQV